MNALAPSLAGQGRLQEAKGVQLEADASSRRCRHLLYLGIGQRQLAAILWRSGELGEAERAARAAVDTLDFSPPFRAHALATLTQIHVSLRRPDAALASAGEAIRILESTGAFSEGESAIRLAPAEAFLAAGNRVAARAAIISARDNVLSRAAHFEDPALRQSFLGDVPENARTVAVAAELE